MSIYYRLDYKKFKYPEHQDQIGEIIRQVSVKLNEKFGLNLGIINLPLDEIIEDYVKRNNLTYLTEEILLKNMSKEEVVQCIQQKLEKLSQNKWEQLIVIDPYLLASNSTEEYKYILKEVFSKSKFKEIIIVTDQRNCDIELQENIKSGANKLQFKFTKEFHDRFWIINRKSGFTTGTSLNGIGKRFSQIQFLDEKDVSALCEILRGLELIDDEK